MGLFKSCCSSISTKVKLSELLINSFLNSSTCFQKFVALKLKSLGHHAQASSRKNDLVQNDIVMIGS